MVAESAVGSLISEVLPLGFGKCKLQIQVPESGPYQTVQQLVGKKVVTSFDTIASDYFGKLDLELGGGKKTLIEFVGGSVEAACALGLADGIVDLVESGDTMRAAGLKPIETILESQAVLIRSSSSNHSELINRITSRIAGVIAAGKYVLCTYNVHRDKLALATKITPGRRAATISPLDDPEWVSVSCMVLKATVADTMDRLQGVGAADILITSISNCRVE